MVRQAKRLKNIKIVSYDWLEDSLLSKSRRPKKEGPYLRDKILKKTKKERKPGANAGKAQKSTRTGKPAAGGGSGIGMDYIIDMLIWILM